jgi:phosphopantetheinyl transferase
VIITLTVPLPRVAVTLLDLNALDGVERPEKLYLTDTERKEYFLLGSERRRREWLGARACLKMMLLETGRLRSLRECEVLKDSRGRPSVVFRTSRGGEVKGDCSLSHKGRYAAAAISFAERARVGVDIEKISPRITRLRASFVNPLDRLPGVLGNDRFHSVLWTAKEAASKVLGTGLGAGLSSLVCRQVGEGLCRMGREGNDLDIEGAFWFREDYTLTLGIGGVLYTK